ncbi:imidazolonepropionase-like domain-containing protein [Streptomyces sp. NPDC018031]|uniref:imidazolonepropionase-like domain-containing protein n=1 Tax=Streptomyces sp. NPDC018031 TaxID=3365033 RepID=UPI0037B72E8E
MLTLHTAPLVLTAVPPAGAGPAPVPGAVPDGAVLVDRDRIAAVGRYAELAAAHPAARVRRWPGVITPGLRQWHGRRLLQHTYHPDPREAAELGTEPLPEERLAGLGMTDARWGASARRGLQRMLRYGTTAVAGTFDLPPVRTAVARSGLTEVPAAGAPGIGAGVSLDPFRNAPGLTDAVPGPLTVGGRADLAAFDVPDERALSRAGAGTCVATVLAGRLVYRER